ncbi:MAG: hypothetical protein Q8N48_02380, partial [Thiobacillus sp.]|nr:hypothetical protein [Thiobacillus sp.]MDP2977657.1 hypothetical protein [Thiobacillus sp.]
CRQECSTTLLIRHELNMTTVRPEPVEGLCFDRLGTNELTDKSGRINSVGVDLPFGTWHIIVALASDSVLLELKTGPFDFRAAKEPAPWEPDEGSADAFPCLQWLRGLLSWPSPG